MTHRRVVVTGLGAVTPLAGDVEHTWKSLIEGRSAVRSITRFDASALPCSIAAEVREKSDAVPDGFDVERYVPKKDARKMDRFIIYGVAAAAQAVEHAGLAEGAEDKHRVGVLIGSGIGGLPCIEENSILAHEKGHRKISPFFIPASLINLASGHVSMRYGFSGPNHSVVTACATGTHAIGDACEIIRRGDADAMIAGGAEGAICNIGIAGFCAARALSTSYNDSPETASRPWDEGRDGFVMGEGAGVVVLEEYERAKERGATIYGECVGYGMSGDAYHMTAPEPNGDGAFRAMQTAFSRSGLLPKDIGYVNAHGTSTPLGDEIELAAVKRIFGDAISGVSISSTKSSVGHLLGAAGGIEAIFALKAMETGELPPTLNLRNPSESCKGVDLVPLEAKKKRVDAVMSNSFGFGGTNATVIFKRV
ncbi:MAG: beta-ketoacyl-ACP synthase II [Rickettsiales bacterium]